jgi:transcriptional regulator with XRE-family HTH domain
MDYSRGGLGQVIRELREAHTPKLTQEQLGRKAGYRAGAGVSMSRIENGVTRPGPRRLAGIAAALGLTVHELETRSAQRSPQPQPKSDPPSEPPVRGAGLDPGQTGAAIGGRPKESTKDQMRRIQGDFNRRHDMAVTKGREFNAVHDRARDDFFLELLRTATTITGLPNPPHEPALNAVIPQNGGSLSPSAEAALRRNVAVHGIAVALASGAGAAAAGEEPDHESAYSAVLAAALLTPAPSDAAHHDARRGPAARATRALLGGGSPAGRTGILAGTALLTGFLASAASPLFAAGTLAWLARRSRRQNDQLRMELDLAEANLAATDRGFDAVMDVLTRATEILGYIAVHASHAQQRWEAHLPESPIDWSDLSQDQQRQYEAFVEVAGRQVLVDSINMTELLTADLEQQARLIHVADDILTLAKHDVELLV